MASASWKNKMGLRFGGPLRYPEKLSRIEYFRCAKRVRRCHLRILSPKGIPGKGPNSVRVRRRTSPPSGGSRDRVYGSVGRKHPCARGVRLHVRILLPPLAAVFRTNRST